MNRDEILNLPAGDELDALVAEKIMGWHKDVTDISSLPCWRDSKGSFQHGVAVDSYEDSEDFHLLHWHPSQSILWAWKVVEKMQGDWWELESMGGDYRATFEKPNQLCKDQTYHSAVAETAPLAICRAALLAVMEEE